MTGPVGKQWLVRLFLELLRCTLQFFTFITTILNKGTEKKYIKHELIT